MTLTIATAIHESSAASPAVKLTVTASASAPNAVPANTVLTLTRIHADGSEHRVLTSNQPRVIPTTWQGFDYHAPFSAAVTYRVDAAGSSATATGYALSDRAWLISPSEPARSVLPDRIKAISDRSVASRAGRFAPVGGRASFIGEGAADGMTGTIAVKVTDEGPLADLLTDDGVILVNTPGDGWAIDWAWIKPKSWTWAPFTGRKGSPFSVCTIAYEESADPDVDLIPVWTIKTMRDYLRANGKTAGDVDLIWDTVADLAIDTRL